MRDGAVAPAVVLKNDYLGNPSVRRITVRVLFADAEPVEITRTEGTFSASQMTVGDRVTVRHSADRRRIELDMDAYDRRVRRRAERANDRAVRRTERRIEQERRDR